MTFNGPIHGPLFRISLHMRADHDWIVAPTISVPFICPSQGQINDLAHSASPICYTLRPVVDVYDRLLFAICTAKLTH